MDLKQRTKEIIKDIKKRHKLTSEKLGKRIGFSKEVLYNYAKLRNVPNAQFIGNLCKEFNVNPVWILTGRGDRYTELEALYKPETVSFLAKPPIVEYPEDLKVDPDEVVLVPMIEAHLDAGGGAFVLSEKAKEYYYFRRDRLKRYATSRSNIVLMVVQGDSMAPTIQTNDIVMIDRGRTVIHNGCIFALGVGESILIKRINLKASGDVQVISDNKTEYPPYDIHLSELRILGQVIWYARHLVSGE